MTVEIRVPSLGESVTEATVAKWYKQIGDPVAADEPLVELETDKVTLEFNAPASGVLAEIVVEEGGEVEVGALLGSINEEARSRRRRPGRARADPAAQAEPPRRATAPWRPRCASCSTSTASTPRRSPRPGPRATSPRATCSPRSRPARTGGAPARGGAPRDAAAAPAATPQVQAERRRRARRARGGAERQARAGRREARPLPPAQPRPPAARSGAAARRPSPALRAPCRARRARSGSG